MIRPFKTKTVFILFALVVGAICLLLVLSSCFLFPKEAPKKDQPSASATSNKPDQKAPEPEVEKKTTQAPKDLTAESEAKDSAINALNSTVTVLNSTVKSLNNTVDVLSRDRERLQAQIDRLNAKFAKPQPLYVTRPYTREEMLDKLWALFPRAQFRDVEGKSFNLTTGDAIAAFLRDKKPARTLSNSHFVQYILSLFAIPDWDTVPVGLAKVSDSEMFPVVFSEEHNDGRVRVAICRIMPDMTLQEIDSQRNRVSFILIL